MLVKLPRPPNVQEVKRMVEQWRQRPYLKPNWLCEPEWRIEIDLDDLVDIEVDEPDLGYEPEF